MVTVFAEDARDGRKLSPKVRRDEIQNFGDGSAGLRVAAWKSDRTSGISASTGTPAYI